MTKIIVNEDLLRKIVRAIDKAIADDVPRIKWELQLETPNYIRFIRTDMINDNLKALALSEDIQFIPFQRYSWHGRMLVDHRNHITYSITTLQNLEAIPKKKQRKAPHFLMSVLAMENGDLVGSEKQLSFFPMEQFEENIYEEDYKSIMGGILNPDEDYRHYVIAYEFERDELQDVQVLLLDKEFKVIDEISVARYIKPDFARLTGVENRINNDNRSDDRTIRSSLSLKPGLKPQLNEIEEEA